MKKFYYFIMSFFIFGLMLISSTGHAQTNDVGISDILVDEYGASNFTATTSLTVSVTNYGTADQVDVPLTLTLRGREGNTISTDTETLSAITNGTTVDYEFTTTLDLSDIGTYDVFVTTDLNGDENTANDQFSKRIYKVSPASFPYFEDFENIRIYTKSYSQDTVNFLGVEGFTYSQSLVNERILFNASIDPYSGRYFLALDGGNFGENKAILTVDLSSLDVNQDEILLNFRYNSIGDENGALDNVYVRGNPSEPWVQAFDWNDGATFIWQFSDNVNVSQILIDNGQNFSELTQIKFQQSDNFNIPTDGAGFDDVELYRQPDLDLGVVGITNPTASSTLSSTENLSVEVENYGSEDQSNFDITLEITNPVGDVSTVTETISSTVTSKSILSIPLTTEFDFSMEGNYKITASTSLTNDGRPQNDTFEGSDVVHFSTLAGITFPYEQDFETANRIEVNNSFGKIIGLPGWSFENTIDEPAARLRTESGTYETGNRSIALDFSSGTPNADAGAVLTLDMSAYDVANDVFLLNFDFASFANEISNPNDRIFVRGSESDPWVEVYDWFTNKTDGVFVNSGDLDITSALQGATQNYSATTQIKWGINTNFRIENQYGLVFDNVAISKVPNNDVRISDISTTLDGEEPAGVATAEKITVTIFNEGLDDQTNFDVNLEISGPNGTVTATETYAGTVTAGGNDTYEFTDDFDFSVAGTYTITASTSLTTDEVVDNDEFETKSYIFSLYTGSFPFYEEFESQATNQIFQESLAQIPGISNGYGYSYTNGGRLAFRNDFQVAPGSGKRIALDNPGGGGINRIYISMDLSAYDTLNNRLNLSLDWYDHGDEPDAIDLIEVRGSSEDPWVQIYDFGTNSNNGAHTSIDLNITDPLKGALQNFSESSQIRISQTDNFPINTDGLSFDNIKIYKSPDTDLGPIAVTKPNLGTDFGATENLEVEVENFGTIDVSAFDIQVDITDPEGNTTSTTESVASLIEAGTTLNVVLSNTFDFSLEGNYQIEVTTILGADENGDNDSYQSFDLVHYDVIESVSLPYEEDFESANYINRNTSKSKVIGLDGWSFINDTEETNTFRTALDQTPGTNRSIVIDNNSGAFGNGAAILSLDMSAYTIADNEVNLAFDFNTFTNQIDNANNRVFVRGSEADPWVEAYNWFANSGAGSAEVNISAILAGATQEFSTTTQVKFGWYGEASVSGDQGLVVDNVNIFATPNNDVRISDITTLLDGEEPAGAAPAEKITLTILNEGLDDQSNFDVTIDLVGPNGTQSVTESYTGTVTAAGGIDTYEFTADFDFSAAGTYQIIARTELTADENIENDEFESSANILSRYTGALPFYEDFTTQASIKTFNEDTPIVPGLSEGIGYIAEVSGVELTFENQTVNNLFPENDGYVALLHNPNTGGIDANFLYFSFDLSSYDTLDNNLVLSLSVVDLGDEASADDRIWVRGSAEDPWVEIADLTGFTHQIINNLDLNITEALKANLQNFSSTTQIKFGQEDNFPALTDGIYFDNVNLYEISPFDIGAVAIVKPNLGTAYTATESLDVEIENFGPAEVNSFDVRIDITNPQGTTSSVTESFTTTIPVGGSVTETFAADFDFSLEGNYQISATTVLAEDEINDNDAFEAEDLVHYEIIPTVALPYEEDFESANYIDRNTTVSNVNGVEGWTFENETEGTNRFRTALDATPGTNRSIVIDNNSGSFGDGAAILSLDMSNYAIADDEVNLAFDFNTFGNQLDNPNNRVFIRGSEADPWVEAYNWFANSGAGSAEFNITTILAGATQDFSSTTQIKFGWYGSASTDLLQGLVVDNVRIFNDPNNDVRISGITTTLDGDEPAGVATAEKITVTIFNEGLDDQSNFDVNIEVTGPNGTVTATETYTGTVAAGGNDTYEFTDDFNFSVAGTYTITASTALTNDEVTDNDEFDTKAYIFSIYAGSLPFYEDFESQATTQSFQQTEPILPGVSSGFAYVYGAGGRLAFRSDFPVRPGSGKKIALDNPGGGGINRVYLSMDLSAYDTLTNNLNLSFDWFDHGDEGNAEDVIEVRGSSEDAWIEIYDFAANTNNGAHTLVNVSITDALKGALQNFSSTTQIRIGQTDNFPINTDGISVDNLYVHESISATQDESLTIEENAVAGDVVGSFTVENAIGNISANLLTPTPYFEVGNNPEEIVVSQFLDYEDLLAGPGVVFDLDVEFTDELTFDTYTARMTVEVTDDGFTAFTAPLAQISTEENKVKGDVIGQLAATGGSGTFSGSIVNATPFVIQNGIDIVANEFIDYEKIIESGSAQIDLTVDYYDEVTRETVTQLVEVTVTDDGVTALNVANQVVTTSETTAPGTILATFNPSDGSGNFSAKVINNSDFTINQNFEISLVNRLDYETLVANGNNILDVPVSFTDNVTRHKIIARMILTVTDDGIAALVANNQTILVPENSDAGTILGSLEISGGTGDYELTYVSDIPNYYSLNQETFEVTTNAFVDYESYLNQGKDLVTVNLTVKDLGSLDSKSFLLKLQVEQDEFATLLPTKSTVSIAENTAVGTVVGQLSVSGGSGSNTFTLVNSPSNLLSFDSESLEFSLNEFADYEALVVQGKATQNFNVKVTDNITREEVTSTFTLKVTDDGIRKLEANQISARIPENTDADVLVGQIELIGGSSDVTLANVSGTSDYVGFDESDLSFSTSQFIDYEAIDISSVNPIVFNLTFIDNVTQQELEVSATFVISNDNFAALTIKDQALNVRENTEIGTLVTTVKVTGGSRTAEVELAQSGSNLFNFNAETGELTIASEIDFETLSANEFDFVFTATDNVTRETVEGVVTITITDDVSDNEVEVTSNKDELLENLIIYANRDGYININGVSNSSSVSEAKVFTVDGKELMTLTFDENDVNSLQSQQRIDKGLFIISVVVDGVLHNNRVMNK